MKISPEELFHEILQTENWESFQGYGPLPGIQKATFDPLCEGKVGSKIRVENSDGSTHVETIVTWAPYDLIEMELGEFSKPLSSIASHFVERWRITGAEVSRSMHLYPKSVLTIPLLRIVSILMRQALQKHTNEICSPVAEKSK